MNETKLNPKHWFWCQNCERRSYSRGCGCDGSICNGGGCDECKPYFRLARQAIKDGTAPSEDQCKANSDMPDFSRLDQNKCPECDGELEQTDRPRVRQCKRCKSEWKRKPTREECEQLVEIMRNNYENTK